MELIFQEEDFIVKTLSAPEEMEEAYRLRHDVFSEELRWVPPSPEGLEKDTYDEFSHYIGVFSQSLELVGHLRFTTTPNPFMVEKEFAVLMPEGSRINKAPDVFEVTRLCVRKDYRSTSGANVSRMLYKSTFQWSISNEMRHSVIVVDYRCFRHLRLSGLTIDPIGEFKVMPDGVKAAVCNIDWHKFDKTARLKKPEFHEWMSTIQAPYPSLSLQHGPCSPHRAFSRYSGHGT